MKNTKFIFMLIASMIVMSFAYFIFQKSQNFLGPQAAMAKTAAKYHCPMHPNYVSDKPGDCPICGMRLVPIEADSGKRMADGGKQKEAKKILFYRHPMRPDVTSPVPAKDEMGMDYIPVYEESKSAEDPKTACVVHECSMLKEGEPCPMLILSEKGEKLECPVCKKKIELDAQDKQLLSKAGYAAILISPQKQQLIGIKTSAAEKRSLEKIIRTVGKIAYDPELYQSQAEYIQSIKSLSHAQTQGDAQGSWAKSLVESSRTKLTRMGLNSQMMESIEKSDAPDKSLLYAVPGGEAWIYANIFEYEIPLVKVGDVLEIEVPALPGKKLAGEIRAIDTVVDAATR